MNSKSVQIISESFIKPHSIPEESKNPIYLPPWDLAMLSVHYIQKGLLFNKPAAKDEENFIQNLLDKLKHSLSLTLVHFYPLAGRLSTRKEENPPSYVVFLDCNDSPGAKFIHANLDMTVSEILAPTYVPVVVQSFFDHDRALNHDGHTRPLLSVQITELIDGVFIGVSMNHAIGDGSSFWNFFNAWSEMFNQSRISRPPVLNRWFPDGYGPIINLPFKHQDEFVIRYEAPQLIERVFHFSAESIAKLKSRANSEFNSTKISSFQSLSALIWRSITRIRNFKPETVTNCRLAINNRSRIEPPLSPDYFGNAIQTVRGVATAGDLMEHDLGWAAWKLHEAVANHTDEAVRGFVNQWLESPWIYQLGQFFDPLSVMMGSSPRFNKYGNEFGMGKAVALRSGYANKFDGKVSCYPGHEGGGSVDLEICLPEASMKALEWDEEFMAAVSS